MKSRYIHLFLLVVLCFSTTFPQTREIRVNVVDPAGAAVTHATVRAASGRSDFSACLTDEHAFLCTVGDSGGVRFEITAKGFKPLKVEYAEKDITCCEYVFVLQVDGTR